MPRSHRLLLIAILILAAALRFYCLDSQSFWNDEGNSVRLAQRSLALVTAGAAGDIHPPGYYYLLWAWIRLFGDSEFAARSLSVVMGLLLVAVTYALGRQFDRPAIGLIAAFLAAISPFQVYYSQEARMYILATLVGAAATYVFVRIVSWETGRLGGRGADGSSTRFINLPIYQLAYILLTAAGLYTHYSYPVVMAVHHAVYGLWLLTTWRRGQVGVRLLRWVGLQLGVLILYLPWLPVAWPKLIGYGAISEAQSPGYILVQALRHYTLGPTAGETTWMGWLLIGYVVLTVVGLARLFTSYISQLAIRLLPLLYALAPIAMMVALSFSRPAYRPKFFLVGTPAFHLILAHAFLLFHPPRQSPNHSITHPPTLQLCNLYTAATLTFIVLTAIPGLHNYYHDPAYARDDYRRMARYIEAVAREGDAVLLNAPNQWEVFTYYYGDRANVYPLPRSRPLDEGATTAELQAIVASHRRIFALYWGLPESDPSRYVEGWLEGHTYRAADSWYGDVRLVVYAVPQTAQVPQRSLDLTLGDAVALRGYALAADAVEAGDILQLTLFWQAEQQPVERYKVFVQLLDSANHIVGQLDSEPGGNLLPTDTWQPGQAVTDRYGILVQSGTPPGEHRLIVGMYSLGTGLRLAAAEDGQSLGDHVVLGLVEVVRPPAPPPVAGLSFQHRPDWSYEGLRLLGYDLYKLGFAHQPDAPLRPGDALHINFYWQAEEVTPADWALHLRLVDESGQEWAALDAPLAGVGYPLSQWTSGEVVRAQFDLIAPGDAPSGRYCLEMIPVAPTGEKGPSWISPPFAVE